MRSSSIKLSGFLIALCSLALSLLAAEATLQWLDKPPTTSSGWGWSASPYKSESNFGDHRTNQLGLRGRPFDYADSDYVVVLVGDSYVEAGAQAFEDMPEQILEAAFAARGFKKRIKVYSIASAGWGQDQEDLALERYFEKYRADLVIHWFTPVNDYWENTFIDRSVDAQAGPLKPTFRLQPDRSLTLVESLTSSSKLVELVRIAWGRAWLGRKATRGDIYAASWDRNLPTSNFAPVASSECPASEVAELDMVAAYRKGLDAMTVVTNERVEDGRTHFSPFIRPTSAIEKYEIDLTHALMQKMNAIATKNKAEFRIFYPKGSDIDAAVRHVKCVRRGDKFYRVDMRDLLEFLSLTPLSDKIVPVTIASDRPTVLSSRDWHLNRFGNEEALAGLVDSLVHSGLALQ